MDEAAREEFKAALAIRHTPGLGARTWKRLLERYGSALDAALHVSTWVPEDLAADRQAQAFRSRAWREAAAAELEAARTLQLPVVLWTDPRYPARLKEIHDPPLFLYGRGRLDLLATPGVAVVGARQCSRHGLDAARRIAGELSRAGLTVISGLALGIDREAHLAGLEGVGSSIAVLGTGLDIDYPEANGDVRGTLAEHGLLVTELPPSTRPAGPNFPVRNRIISGLSLGVVVVEASEKSGSLITARLALEQGREVFALAGPDSLPTYAGCRDLLAQGATLVQSAEDILRELAPLLRDEVRPTRPQRTAPVRGALPVPPTAPPGTAAPRPGQARPEAAGKGHGRGAPSRISAHIPVEAPVEIPSWTTDEAASGALAGSPLVRNGRRKGGRGAGNGLSTAGTADGAVAGLEAADHGRRSAPASTATAAGRSAPRTSARSPGGAGRPGPAPVRPDPPALPALPDMASLSLDERAVVALLAGAKLHFDELCRSLDWEASKVGRVLVGLEVLGAIRKWPGMFYTLA